MFNSKAINLILAGIDASDDLKDRVLKFVNVSEAKKTIRKMKISKADGLQSIPSAANLIGKEIARRVLRPMSKVFIDAPWDIRDGVMYTNSNGHRMPPFKMASDLKIVDSREEVVALVSTARRSLAGLIVAAPQMYQLLVYLYLYKDDILVFSDRHKHALELLESLISVLGISYQYQNRYMDEEAFLSTVSSEFLRRTLEEGFSSESFMGMVEDLDEADYEKNVYNHIKSSIISTLKATEVFTDEESYSLGLKITKNLRDLDKLDVQTLKDTLVALFRTNEHVVKCKNGRARGTHDIDIQDVDCLWNIGQYEEFDKIIDEKAEVINIDVEKLMISLGVSREVVSRMPLEMKEAIKNNIQTENKGVRHLDILSVMSYFYSKYHYYLKVYDFDVFEVEDSINR